MEAADGGGGAPERTERLRNVSAFWLMALLHSSMIFVLGTAAHDLLTPSEYLESDPSAMEAEPVSAEADTVTCNPTSTGSIIAVTILVNLSYGLILMFFFYMLPSFFKMVLVETVAVLGCVIVAFAPNMLVMYVGVGLIGAAYCMFEFTIPPLATKYHMNCTTAYSSGVGAAHILGSAFYVIAKSYLLLDRAVIFLSLAAFSGLGFLIYLFVLADPLYKQPCTEKSEEGEEEEDSNNWKGSGSLILRTTTLAEVLSVASVMAPTLVLVVLVYLFEYFINIGLYEHVAVPGEPAVTPAEQYRWFMLTYHITGFVFRTLPFLIHLTEYLEVFVILQAINVLLFLAQALWLFIPHFWLILVLIVYEGSMAGIVYLISLHRARSLFDDCREKQLATCMVLLAEGVGIALAGLAALPVHEAICYKFNAD